MGSTLFPFDMAALIQIWLSLIGCPSHFPDWLGKQHLVTKSHGTPALLPFPQCRDPQDP